MNPSKHRRLTSTRHAWVILMLPGWVLFCAAGWGSLLWLMIRGCLP